MGYDREHRDCVIAEGHCYSYAPGHHIHFIHARHIGETPWGWRDGVVEEVAQDGTVRVRYLVEDVAISFWHHADLTRFLKSGDLVRVHERYYALGGPFGWLNIEVHDGLGPVPEPENPGVWAAETTGYVVDLSTGNALALDHETTLAELNEEG